VVARALASCRRRVASVGQILDTAEWLNVGDQPNARTLFHHLAAARRFHPATVGGPGAITATNNFLAPVRFRAWQHSRWVL